MGWARLLHINGPNNIGDMMRLGRLARAAVNVMSTRGSGAVCVTSSAIFGLRRQLLSSIGRCIARARARVRCPRRVFRQEKNITISRHDQPFTTGEDKKAILALPCTISYFLRVKCKRRFFVFRSLIIITKI